jgi:hypothetical protein
MESPQFWRGRWASRGPSCVSGVQPGRPERNLLRHSEDQIDDEPPMASLWPKWRSGPGPGLPSGPSRRRGLDPHPTLGKPNRSAAVQQPRLGTLAVCVQLVLYMLSEQISRYIFNRVNTAKSGTDTRECCSDSRSAPSMPRLCHGFALTRGTAWPGIDIKVEPGQGALAREH